MSLVYGYNGSNLAYRVAPTSLEAPSLATRGEPAMGGADFEDPAAALTIVGHRPFTVEETDCAQPRLFTGWTTVRAIGRLPEQGLLAGPDARIHDMTIVDLNALFGFRIISGSDGKRPAETWSERLTWLLGSSYLSGLIEDTGFVRPYTRPMDAADYRGGYPSAVCDDLCERVGPGYKSFNYFAFWDATAAAVGLFFDIQDEATYDSTLRVSNDLDDVDGATTFAPDTAARLERDPEGTYSEVIVEYRHGRVFRSRAATAATYIRRGASVNYPYTGLASTAASQAERLLDQHGTEQDKITCTINVPSTAAGLVTAGQRMDVKFTHMPGYDTFTSMRVVACTPKPCDNTGARYDIALELVSPRPASSEEGPCPDAMETQEIEPNLSATCSADGFVAYGCQARWPPIVPTPNWVGSWNFATYNHDGTGVDCAGAGAANRCRIFALGDGTLEIRTGIYDTVGNVRLELRHWDPLALEDVTDETQTGHTPETFTFIVSSADGYCTHYVDLYDIAPVEGGFGFAGATWTAAGDTVVDVGPPPPPPGVTTPHTTDPTVNDDSGAGYVVGSHWINTATGHEFVNVDNTNGAAVWVSTTAASLTVEEADGTPTDSAVTKIKFPNGTLAIASHEVTYTPPTPTVYAPTTADYLVGTAQAGLSAEIVVGTAPGGELGGTWASPTVDATHSGSAHLALGSTSSTAAAGDHVHAGGELLISDTPSTPLVFADILQNEAEDDFLYG